MRGEEWVSHTLTLAGFLCNVPQHPRSSKLGCPSPNECLIYKGRKLARLSGLQVVVNGLYSAWMLVAIGVLQWSFFFFFLWPGQGRESSVIEFIDDRKMWSAVNQYEGRTVIQTKLEGKRPVWTSWNSVETMQGSAPGSTKSLHWCGMGTDWQGNSSAERYLGVLMDGTLLSQQCSLAAKAADSILGCFKECLSQYLEASCYFSLLGTH